MLNRTFTLSKVHGFIQEVYDSRSAFEANLDKMKMITQEQLKGENFKFKVRLKLFEYQCVRMR